MAFIDLHCHPLPAVDDGVRTPEDGVALLVALATAGFGTVVATPHVRSGLWDNRRESREAARAVLQTAMDAALARGEVLPTLLLAGEHMFDDVFHDLLAKGEALTYPGGGAALVEFPYDHIPLRSELQLWRMGRAGVRPILAHPERYVPVQHSTDKYEEILGAGAWGILDVMSLVGAYGRRAEATAETLLRAGMYFAACTDAHKPADVPVVIEAIDVLRKRVGEDGVQRLLGTQPARVLAEASRPKGPVAPPVGHVK